MRKKYYSVLIVLLIFISCILIIYQKSDILFIKILSMFDKGSERGDIKDLVKEQETNQEETKDIQKQAKNEEIQNTGQKQETSKDSQKNTKEPIVQKIQNEPIIAENITKIETKDKAEIMKIILKKLSKEDISYLLSLAKDGLTQEEKERAKALAYQRFTREEIEEIKRLYEKYRHLIR